MSGETASGLERLAVCPTSGAIPVRVHETGEGAERGNEIHGFAEAVLAGHKSKEQALLDVPLDWRQTCASLDWSMLLAGMVPGSILSESAYAVHLVTGGARLLGRSLGRNYRDATTDEIPGTNDIEGVLEDGRPIVRDIKTGQPVAPCRENWQVRFHAYVMHRLTGAPDVVAGLAYVREDGSVHLDEAPFEPADHADFIDDLRAVRARVLEAAEAYARGVVDVSAGDHCKYCPAFNVCPSQVALVRHLAIDLADLDTTIGALSPEQAGIAWAKWKKLDPLLERVGKALKAYARKNVVTLPDGRVVTEIAKSRANINGERALAIAREYGATEAELAECMQRTEYTELRAIKPKAARDA